MIYTENTFSFESQVEMLQFTEIALEKRQRQSLRSLHLHVEHRRVPLAYIDQPAVHDLTGLRELSLSIDEHSESLETWNVPRFLQPRLSVKAVVINTKNPEACFREQRRIAEALEVALVTPEKDVESLKEFWYEDADESFVQWLIRAGGMKQALQRLVKDNINA